MIRSGVNVTRQPVRTAPCRAEGGEGSYLRPTTRLRHLDGLAPPTRGAARRGNTIYVVQLWEVV